MILKVGSNDANTAGEVTRFGQWFKRYASSYAPPVDGYYGYAERDAVKILQRNLKTVAITGEFDEATAAAVKYRWGATVNTPGTAPTPPAHRPIWMYTAPGSGAPGNVGPSFQLGERCRNVLHINHQWLGYPIGGYLGVMGGDPAFSYEDVVGFEGAELERQIALCPDLNDPKLEIWLAAYSQSADGMLMAAQRLFGDDGRFRHLRERINGIILFGNPATAGTGIARKTFPDWLNRLTRNVNYDNDFYAVANDKIRPLFYEWFVKADTDMPFIVYTAQIIIPAIANLLPGIGQIMAAPLSMLLGLIPGATGAASRPPNPELIHLLSLEGMLNSLPDMMGLITALPGLQAHGGYEFDPVMMNRAYDIVAGFRR